jgi:hypothetical protein
VFAAKLPQPYCKVVSQIGFQPINSILQQTHGYVVAKSGKQHGYVVANSQQNVQ